LISPTVRSIEKSTRLALDNGKREDTEKGTDKDISVGVIPEQKKRASEEVAPHTKVSRSAKTTGKKNHTRGTFSVNNAKKVTNPV